MQIIQNAKLIESTGSAFTKDKNTLPRLLNFLFQDPDKVARSKLLCTRSQLQEGEQNENNPIYMAAVDNFNNYSINSGGLICDDVILKERSINPEQENTSGSITLYYFSRNS